MNRIVATSLLYLLHCSLTAAQAPDAGELRSIDQLRQIAELIKSCKIPALPPGVIDPSASEGFLDVHGPPINVVWNVELHPSIRSRYVGSVEFSEPSYYEMPATDNYCNKPKTNKAECKRRWLMGVKIFHQDEQHPLQFKYEFDVTPHGLEISQVFEKSAKSKPSNGLPEMPNRIPARITQSSLR